MRASIGCILHTDNILCGVLQVVVCLWMYIIFPHSKWYMASYTHSSIIFIELSLKFRGAQNSQRNFTKTDFLLQVFHIRYCHPDGMWAGYNNLPQDMLRHV